MAVGHRLTNLLGSLPSPDFKEQKMEWIDIDEEEPEEDEPVLFKEMFCNEYHVGYWSKKGNCMDEYLGKRQGQRWSIKKWKHIDD